MGKTPKQEPVGNDRQAMAQQPQQQQQPTYTAPAQPVATPQPIQPQPQQQPPAYTEATAHREPASSAMPRAVMESESLAREIKDGSMSGFVGGGTTLAGEVAFKGMLRVDGHLTGTIISEKGTLIVSSGGRVDADINVAIAKINGSIHGNIVANERIELGRTAQVHGDIQTPVLIIEQGAVFEGNCRMGTAKDAPVRETQRESLSAKEAAAARNKLPQPASSTSSATGTLG
ncbi:MAG TPA: polymer-forming cytoskeletal protein [Pyrinomonadaceae bacterium]|nr:polymer-forming cytoskeletal protein [Pyrinomonadaceae bacterium]